VTEIKFRCRQCDTIWHATQRDIAENKKIKRNITMGKFDNMTTFSVDKTLRKNAHIAQQQAAYRDWERCPNCYSRDVERILIEIGNDVNNVNIIPENPVVQPSIYANNTPNYYKAPENALPRYNKASNAHIDTPSMALKVLTAFFVLLMPYVALIVIPIRKPYSRSTNKACMIYCAFMCVWVFGMMFHKIPSANNALPAETTTVRNEHIEEIINVQQFSQVSYNKMIEIMGSEPVDIEKWSNPISENESHPMTIYAYKVPEWGAYVEFMFPDEADKLVRMNVFSEKYWSGIGNDFKVTEDTSANSLFAMFGIKPKKDNQYPNSVNYRTETSLNSKIAARYLLVNQKIDDFWVSNMDADAKIIKEVKITYNDDFFGGYEPFS
jgi:hypothetical protein